MIVTRKRLLFAPFLALLVLSFVLVSVSEYRRRTFDARWAKVHSDLSKDELRELLGEPDQIYSAAGGQSNSTIGSAVLDWVFDASYERWAYGERRMFTLEPSFPYLTLALDGLFGPLDRDHVVYFTSDGKVLRKSYPYRVGPFRGHFSQ
jgi:hypothetical protein